jgi:uncharacterized protein YciI
VERASRSTSPLFVFPLMSEYLYKIQPARVGMLSEGSTPEEAAILSQHFDYLSRLVDEAAVILAGRTLTTDEHSFGIVIFRAESDDDARRIMENDPVVKTGVMRAELYPYRIALMSGA